MGLHAYGTNNALLRSLKCVSIAVESKENHHTLAGYLLDRDLRTPQLRKGIHAFDFFSCA